MAVLDPFEIRAGAAAVASLISQGPLCGSIRLPGVGDVTSLALVPEASQAWISLQLLIQFLELLERCLVVLTGAFCQNLHAEICVSHLLFVVFLALLVVVGQIQSAA